MKFENFNCDNGKFDIFVYVGFVEKTIRIYLLLDNGSNKSDCGLWNNVFIDSLDNILVKRFSNRSRRKKFVKFSDEESNICEYRVLDVNDIVVNVFKTEVYCMLCGIILFKLQCFYSLGFLCIDGEICEIDLDDINRYFVGDIDMEFLLVEI